MTTPDNVRKPRNPTSTEALAERLLDRAEYEHHPYITTYGSMSGDLYRQRAAATLPARVRLYVERHLHFALADFAPGTFLAMDYCDSDEHWTRDTAPTGLLIQKRGNFATRVPMRWASNGRRVTFEPSPVHSQSITINLNCPNGGEKLTRTLCRLIAAAVHAEFPMRGYAPRARPLDA